MKNVVDSEKHTDFEKRIREKCGVPVKKEYAAQLGLPVPTEWVLTTKAYADKLEKHIKDEEENKLKDDANEGKAQGEKKGKKEARIDDKKEEKTQGEKKGEKESKSNDKKEEKTQGEKKGEKESKSNDKKERKNARRKEGKKGIQK